MNLPLKWQEMNIFLTNKDRKTIIDALKVKAASIRHEATAAAQAVGKWDNDATESLIDEAAYVDGLIHTLEENV